MHDKVTSIIEHMARSHEEMATILEIKRDIVVHMSYIINAIPDDNMTFGGMEDIAKNSMSITENITSYLNSLADFEEAIAENLTHVMKEMNGSDDGE